MSNFEKFNISYKKSKIAIIGLGYVGLPLAVEFGKKREVIGFDTNKNRINDLNNLLESSLETTPEEIKSAKKLIFTNNIDEIKSCKIFIITVPTPIDTKGFQKAYNFGKLMNYKSFFNGKSRNSYNIDTFSDR